MYKITYYKKMEDDSKISKYNEASLKVKRIDFSQKAINEFRTNMLRWNEMYNKYNYEIIISEIISLLQEVRSKMGSEEKKTSESYRTLMIRALDVLKIHSQITTHSLGKESKKEVVDYENWTLLRNIIFQVEDYTREMIEQHGYGSPNEEEEEGYD